MGIPFSGLITPATQPNWLSNLLGICSTLGLPVTSWQSGGVARTLLTALTFMLSGEDGIISIMAQGGFLDYAATGTVTYTTPQGTTITVPVTVDLSTNPTASPGWLHVLASSVYNVQYLQASAASGTEYFANTSGGSYGPFAALSYHVSNPATGKTYSNQSSLTIPASTVVGTSITGVTNSGGLYQVATSSAHGLATGAVIYITGVAGTGGLNPNGIWMVTVVDATHFNLQGSVFAGAYTSGGTVYTTTSAAFAADVVGSGSTAASGTLTQAVTALLGVTCTNLAAFTGSNFESNVALAARCRTKLATISPNGAKNAYVFFAKSAAQLLAAQTPPETLKNGPISQAISQTNPATGAVTTTIANASGATDGVSNLAVTAATGNGVSPIVLTVGSTTGLVVGDPIYVSGINGNTAANGWHTVSALTGTTITLETASSGNGAYVSGGTVEGGDLGMVDFIIQSNCVPATVTAVTQWATPQNVTVTITVYVPAAQAANVVAAISTALTLYFGTVPIGGFVTGVPTANTLPFDEVLGVVEAAAGYIQDATLTLNGGTSDIAVGATSIPLLVWSGGSPAAAITVQVF